MLRARWDKSIERVIVEKVFEGGKVFGYARLTRDEFARFMIQAEEVYYEAFAGVHIEPWPDERVELPATAVLDDPEADLPTLVRMDDGRSRVEFDFSDDANLDRRLGELGRE
jgi:hypothetical protein